MLSPHALIDVRVVDVVYGEVQENGRVVYSDCSSESRVGGTEGGGGRRREGGEEEEEQEERRRRRRGEKDELLGVAGVG